MVHISLWFMLMMIIFWAEAYIIWRKNEASVVGRKEIGLEINADKSKYMVISRDQNAGRSHNIKSDNSSFERVKQLKYLGTILTVRNSIQKEIKSRLNSDNDC
jgi:hypothetical protein